MLKVIRPKRILMILENGSFPEDTRVYLEAIALLEAGYEMTVVCPTGKRRSLYEWVEGVHVYRYPRTPEFSGFLGYLFEYSYSLAMAFLYATWILMRRGFDAVHVHCPPDLNSTLAIVFKCLGKKFIVDLHDLSPELYQAQKGGNANRWLVKGLRFFEKLASRNANALIATNQTQNRIQIDRCGADPRRCYVVRNGPNELFSPQVAPLEELRFPGKIVLGYVGLMGVQDGVDYLIRAIEHLKKRRTDFVAVLIGRGPALESLKKLTIDLGLKDHVIFTGFIEFRKIPNYIASFDICLTPDPSNSYNDSCTTIKTMEYMAVGRPTVAFRTKENEITAGEAAVYAENNSVEAFAALIEKLASNPELRIRMGQIGLKRIEQSLGWSHQKKILIQVYQDLFNGPLDHGLRCQFYFDGKLDKQFEDTLAADIESAKLSLAFRQFYRVRPLLPNKIRQVIQRTRSRRLQLQDKWFIPESLENSLKTLSQPLVSPWPSLKEFALVLTHDVETQSGFSQILKLAELEESLGYRSSWNIVPYKYKIDLGLIKELTNRGHEISIHGYNHDGRLFFSKEIFDSRVPMINRALEEFGAVGFRAPMVHRNICWMQQLNIEYDSSCFDIDPFQAMPGGVGSIWPFSVGKFVELPYTMPQDHTLFVALNETSDRIWREKLDFIRRYHGMAMMLTHPDYLDNPNGLRIYKEFLGWIRDNLDPWHVLPRDISRWFREQFAVAKISAEDVKDVNDVRFGRRGFHRSQRDDRK